MSGNSAPNALFTSNPTFFRDDHKDGEDVLSDQNLRRPIDNIRSRPRESRLTRQQFENLLDSYYADRAPPAASSVRPGDHANVAGGRLVRQIALASSFALMVGFGLGLYTLSIQGGDTQLGKSFNGFLSGIVARLAPAPQTGKAGVTGAVKAAPTSFNTTSAKPVKTASVTVSDVSGTIKAGIALKLALNPASNTHQVKVKITNVPGDAVLTAGKRNASGDWVLQPGDLDKVALVLSSNRNKPLQLGVEVIEAKTGELLTPVRDMKVAVIRSVRATPRDF